MKRLILIPILVLSTFLVFSEIPEKDIIKAVKSGKVDLLSSYINEGIDVNAYYTKSQDKTLLHYAILANQADIVKLLIENGADTEIPSKGRTPLMIAAANDRLQIARYLLDQGAIVDAVDKGGNTALYYSAKNASLRMNRLLVQRGADVKHNNNRRWMPHDNAISANKDTVSDYLQTMVARKDTYWDVPDYQDGPHMLWENSKAVLAFYLYRDSTTNFTILNDRFIDFPGDTLKFECFFRDNKSYTVYKKLLEQKSKYEDVDQIFTIGDLHGQYDTLRSLLVNNEIIDEDLNWIWGENHLVLTGDVFDRGGQVTDCLWLLYKLERQARNAGGEVHLLLGNHEIMNITNDLRYLNKKYEFFSTYFDLNYSQFYTPNTVLGQWLRSKNTMLIINDILFVHGGISPEMFSKRLSVDSVNVCLRNFLNMNYNKKSAPLLNFLLFTYGPFWYRGYFRNGDIPAETTQAQLDSILQFYNISHLIIGHTDVKSISPMYDGKVFPIDIPFEYPQFRQQSLLIKGHRFYKAYSDGTKVLLL